MKTFAFVLSAIAVLALTATDVKAQSAASDCPVLQVTGLKPDSGMLMLAVYDSRESFFKKPVWVGGQPVGASSTMQVSVCNVSADEIAVTAFQDMNGNQKLDTNPLGIPTEPYAASGKPSMFGAPTWNDTKVAYKGATAPIAIKF